MRFRIIVRTCKGRESIVSNLLASLPEAEVCFDDTGKGAMGNFLKSLRMSGEAPTLMMEDDTLLTEDFLPKVTDAINANPDSVIQFFSRNKDDLRIGSRWQPGGSFIMGQCHYMPRTMCRALLDYAQDWPRLEEHPHGTDLMVADFLKSLRIRYWKHVPSLVDHLPTKSMIDPRRSTSRKSLTFENPMKDMIR
mgnify:CR=1 FL=1